MFRRNPERRVREKQTQIILGSIAEVTLEIGGKNLIVKINMGTQRPHGSRIRSRRLVQSHGHQKTHPKLPQTQSQHILSPLLNFPTLAR